MTSTERSLLVNRIKSSISQKFDISKYSDGYIRNNTNCYAYSIGSTVCNMDLYRIGAISGKKPFEEEFYSIGEVKGLFYSDLETLGIKFEPSSEEEVINENQYKIALFVKEYANGGIYGFHFLRFQNGIWSEKFGKQLPNEVGKTLKGVYNYFPWKLVGIVKITM